MDSFDLLIQLINTLIILLLDPILSLSITGIHTSLLYVSAILLIAAVLTTTLRIYAAG